ncbi:MAG: hypothetical protein WBA97_34385 [Actinophytocola sp.]|uniref:hypothetical protein n=1 Tax=Actinophytocola sp. TaxID=1872138 RepID=UPI003C731F70
MSQQDMDRTAYLEARVGELHTTIGDLREIVANVTEDWRKADQQHARDVELLLWLHAEAVWREQDLTRQRDAWWEVQSVRIGAVIVERDDTVREVGRLRREVEFEANGADTFGDADARAEAAWDAETPTGQRNQTLRDIAFEMAREGASNHQILARLAHASDAMGKYTDANLYRKWTRLLGMIREVRRAGIESGGESDD